MNKARKVDNSIECPADNFLYIIVEILDPIFYKFKFTPNMITTLSFISGLYSVILLNNNSICLSSIFYMIAYLFDHLDGYYARNHNMCTVFGDYYDHITDIIQFILIIYVIYKKNRRHLIKHIYLIIILGCFLAINTGCVECHYDSDESESLSIFKKLCINKNLIHYTKFFGCGTFQLYIVYLILTININDNLKSN
jgi:hypothetical protein